MVSIQPVVLVAAGRRGEVAAAVPGRLHRTDERRTDLVVLENPHSRGGGAAR